ncbi:hypothetical protein [Haloferula sargassicola]|uniref:AlgX/AlgJ SGNH hydrolase-like domain-containing protein n=1 Tax=Haloferula sargassicola TaxID=490096 RepID=A0ABP9UJC6_9BACT
MARLLRFRRFFQALLALVVVGGFFLTTWVNPWRVVNVPWSSKALDPYRDIEKNFSRTCKAGLAASRQWDTAVFGSSRVDIGIDPNGPHLASRNAVNLGLNAGLLHENKAAFDYFMARQEKPKLVIFFIDAGDLTMADQRREEGLADFTNSPLKPGSQGIESWFRDHCGVSSISSSIEVLRRAAEKEPALYSPRGFRTEAERLEHPRKQIAGLYLSTILRIARNRTALDGLDEGKLNEVRDIIRQCRSKGSRLLLVMPPNHALFQLAFPSLGGSDPWFERDRMALARLAEEGGPEVEFWDFQDGHPLNSDRLPEEGQMEHWIDLFHFTPEIGEKMLSAMLDERAGYGMELRPGEVQAQVERLKRQLANWAEAHPENMRFLSKSLEKFQ